jgi:hypothetical protein
MAGAATVFALINAWAAEEYQTASAAARCSTVPASSKVFLPKHKMPCPDPAFVQ